MKFIVDFDCSRDLEVAMGLLFFIEKMGIVNFKKLYCLEHWFSDIVIVEY